jgi:hypothetical protein
MKQIQEVIFCSNEYSDPPTHFEINLTQEDIDKIKKCKKFIEDNPEISNIRLYAKDVTGLDYDEETKEYIETGWRSDVHYYTVFSDAVYFYAQNKYDSGDYIETDVTI